MNTLANSDDEVILQVMNGNLDNSRLSAELLIDTTTKTGDNLVSYYSNHMRDESSQYFNSGYPLFTGYFA